MSNCKARTSIKFFSLSLALVLGALFFNQAAQAAQIYVKFESKQLAIGEEFPVVFYLDAEGEDINALEGVISFSTDSLELIDLSDAGSLFSFWVESPALSDSGKINFSGIVPGGYSGKQGSLFTAYFKALASGRTELSLDSGQALLNDGQASQTRLVFASEGLGISTDIFSATSSVYEKIKDDEAPEEFPVYLDRNPDIFSGAWFIAFSTQDKKSGLAGYYVRELRPGKKGSDFIPATSPYLLDDQSLRSDVYVKAVDKAGNERVVRLPAQVESSPVLNISLIKAVALSILLILGIIALWLWLKKKKA